MLSSHLAKTSSALVSSNATFLARVLGVSQVQSRNFSVAFNVKSKFEAAFENRKKAAQGTHKQE